MKFTSFAIAALSISTNTLNTLAATTRKTTTTTTSVTEMVDVVVTPDGTVVGGTSVDEGSFNTQALGGTTCTSPGADAYRTGVKLDCCDGQNAMLQPCGPDRPSESCFYCPPSRSPRGPDLCTTRVPMDGNSIWKHQGGANSCNGSYNDEGFSQCKGDPTSISLDMSHVRQKDNCFAYNTSEKLPFKPSQIREISFDAQWDQCGDVWTAPIWLCPSSWEINQGQSGEIDFIETCRSNNNYSIATAVICDQHLEKDNKCYEPNWGHGGSSNGAKHFIGKIDHNSGDWTMHKCDNLNETNVANCQLISRYPRYLFTNNGSKKNMDFHFVSDLWGGDGGDGGFANCGNYQKTETNCKYTVANIKVVHK